MDITQLDRDVISSIVDRWSAATAEQEEERARIPLKVLLGEAVDLAEVIDKHYEDTTVHGKVRRGLNSVAAKGAIHAKISTEIRELQVAVAFVQSRYLVLVEKASSAPIDQADEILNELRSALSFVLEDGNHPSGEEQLEKLRTEYGDVTSHDGLAMALEGYAELAAQHKDALLELGGFESEWIAQAFQVAQALRQRSADRLTGQIPQEQQDTLRLRNRLLGALMDRMRNSRRAIRYVFRDYPEILTKAGSDYSRSRRREQRKNASGEVVEEVEEVDAASETGVPEGVAG